MKVVHLSLSEISSHSGLMACAVAIGNFDGVHIGHRSIIHSLKEYSRQNALPSVVMSFEPFPREYFSSQNESAYANSGKAIGGFRIMDVDEKILALSELEIDYYYIVRFDHDLSNMTAENFIQELLVDKLGVKSIFVGRDFCFGKSRLGNVDLLNKLSQLHGYDVNVIEDYCVDELRVSSSLVRNILRKGDVEAATKLLNKPYFILGDVIHGDKRGREIGFPTANIAINEKRLLIKGVFVVKCTLKPDEDDEKSILGVANIGYRPTFSLDKPLIEINLFNWQDEIYHQRVKVEFLFKVRDEKKFDGIASLKKQIEQDVNVAQNYIIENQIGSENA